MHNTKSSGQQIKNDLGREHSFATHSVAGPTDQVSMYRVPLCL